MLKVRVFLLTVSTVFVLLGCFTKKTWLSDEIKNINPYKVGQELTFISSRGIVNTLRIKKVEDGRFPDGLGAFLNERLIVNAFRESKTIRGGTEETILTAFARTNKYEEKVDFSLSLRDTYLKMKFVTFSDYQNLALTNLTTDYYNYNDVVHFKYYPNRKISANEIVEFFWSKTYGYVRLIQKDRIVWDLKNIE